MQTATKDKPTKTLTLTDAELGALKWLLVEQAQRMDDDGNDGAFDGTPLKAIYSKVKQAEG